MVASNFKYQWGSDGEEVEDNSDSEDDDDYQDDNQMPQPPNMLIIDENEADATETELEAAEEDL